MPSGVMTMPCDRTAPNGETYRFEMDLEAILEMESKDPEFSLMKVMNRVGSTMRITDLVKITKALGWDYKEFVKAGFTVVDLAEIVENCIQDLGFPSEAPEPST